MGELKWSELERIIDAALLRSGVEDAEIYLREIRSPITGAIYAAVEDDGELRVFDYDPNRQGLFLNLE